jgi:hypothetical protein
MLGKMCNNQTIANKKSADAVRMSDRDNVNPDQ